MTVSQSYSHAHMKRRERDPILCRECGQITRPTRPWGDEDDHCWECGSVDFQWLTADIARLAERFMLDRDVDARTAVLLAEEMLEQETGG